MIKADFLDLETRWQLLAQSYQFPEQATSFIRQFGIRRQHTPPPNEGPPSSASSSSASSSAANHVGAFALDSAFGVSPQVRNTTAITRRIGNS